MSNLATATSIDLKGSSADIIYDWLLTSLSVHDFDERAMEIVEANTPIDGVLCLPERLSVNRMEEIRMCLIYWEAISKMPKQKMWKTLANSKNISEFRVIKAAILKHFDNNLPSFFELKAVVEKENKLLELQKSIVKHSGY